MQFKNSKKVFENAIESGILSEETSALNYAGRFMYMGTTDGGIDYFKNIFTRKYGFDSTTILLTNEL